MTNIKNFQFPPFLIISNFLVKSKMAAMLAAIYTQDEMADLMSLKGFLKIE